MPFAENLSVFFADMGVPCAANGVNFVGLLDQPDETLSGAGINVLSTMYLLAVTTATVAAAGIDSGTSLTANGASYLVRDLILIDDGAITHLTLTKI